MNPLVVEDEHTVKYTENQPLACTRALQDAIFSETRLLTSRSCASDRLRPPSPLIPSELARPFCSYSPLYFQYLFIRNLNTNTL